MYTLLIVHIFLLLFTSQKWEYMSPSFLLAAAKTGNNFSFELRRAWFVSEQSLQKRPIKLLVVSEAMTWMTILQTASQLTSCLEQATNL